MGYGLSKLSAELLGTEEFNVLVTIFTDGQENASIEYTGELVEKMVEDLKTKRWTFTYIGTDHDVDSIAALLSITNVMRFKKNAAGIQGFLRREQGARYGYSEKIRNKKNTENNYYGKDKKEG